MTPKSDMRWGGVTAPTMTIIFFVLKFAFAIQIIELFLRNGRKIICNGAVWDGVGWGRNGLGKPGHDWDRTPQNQVRSFPKTVFVNFCWEA